MLSQNGWFCYLIAVWEKLTFEANERECDARLQKSMDRPPDSSTVHRMRVASRMQRTQLVISAAKMA
ncbi:MAG: hypothetical protein AAF702_07815 [Chloroflexota bacterium]